MKKNTFFLHRLNKIQVIKPLKHLCPKKRLVTPSIIMAVVMILQMSNPVITHAGNTKTDKKIELLFDAVEKKDGDKVKRLTDRGIDVNGINQEGNTPLHIAVENDDENMVRLLLDKEAKRIINKNGQTALTLAIEHDNAFILNLLLTNYPYLMNTEMDEIRKKDKNGNTLLHKAAEYDSIACCLYLLNHEADLEAENINGETPLITAAKNDSNLIMSFLMNESMANIEKKDDKNNSIVHILSSNGNYDMLRLFFAEGGKDLSVNSKNLDGLTPLHCTAGNQNQQEDTQNIVNLLIEKGAKVNEKDNKGQTPLHVMSKNNSKNSKDIIELLLKKGANINLVDNKSQNPLHIIAKSNHESPKDIIKLLIEKGAKVNEKDAEGQTPLHIIAQRNPENLKDIIELLLEKGANINLVDNKSQTPLHIIAQHNPKILKDIIEPLLKKGANLNLLNNKGQTPLHIITKHSTENLEDVVKLLIEKGATVTEKDVEGQAPLHIIAKRNPEILKDIMGTLIKQGVDLNLMDDTGRTPLHFVTQYNTEKLTDTIELLTKNGANVNAKNNEGQTPLHFVTRRNLENLKDIIKLLIEKGAEVNEKDSKGLTPLHKITSYIPKNLDDINRFSSYGYLTGRDPENLKDIMEFLIENGADPNLVDNRGWTPLHFVAQYNHEKSKDIIKLLIEKGSNLNLVDNQGQTPLHIIAQRNPENLKDIIELLIENGSNLDLVDNKGQTPLQIIAQRNPKNLKNIIEFLIEKGVDPNLIVNNEGESLLMVAIERGQIDLIKLLIEKGVDPNLKNIKGKNALMHLLENSKRYKKSEMKKLIQLFSQKKIDFTAEDNNGHTAFSYIRSEENFILKCLGIYGNINIIDRWENLYWGLQNEFFNNQDNSKKDFESYFEKSIQDLIDIGLDINKEDKQGHVLLDSGYIVNRSSKIIDLMKKGADLSKLKSIKNILSEISPFSEDLLKQRTSTLLQNEENLENWIKILQELNSLYYDYKSKYRDKSHCENQCKKILLEASKISEADTLIDLCTSFFGTNINFNKEELFNNTLENKNWSAAAILAKGNTDLLSKLKDELIKDNAINKNNLEISTIIHNPRLYDFDLIKFLLDELEKEDPNLKNEVLASSFKEKCLVEHSYFEKDLIDYLILDKGANANVKNKNGDTLLSLGFKNRHFYLYLLESVGDDVDAYLPDFIDYIMTCNGRWSRLEDYLPFIKKIKNINFQDENGNTLLHSAIKSRSLDLTIFLITRGADITIRNKAGHTAFESDDPTKKLEFDKNNKYDCDFSDKLIFFAADGNFELVKLLVNNGGTLLNNEYKIEYKNNIPSVEYYFQSYPSGLFEKAIGRSIFHNNLDIAEFLLKHFEVSLYCLDLGDNSIIGYLTFLSDGRAIDSRADFILKHSQYIVNETFHNMNIFSFWCIFFNFLKCGDIGKVKWILENNTVDFKSRVDYEFQSGLCGALELYAEVLHRRYDDEETEKREFTNTFKLLKEKGLISEKFIKIIEEGHCCHKCQRYLI